MATAPTTVGKSLTKTLPNALAEAGRQQQTNSRTIREMAYKALVICSDQNIIVDAWLPETVGLDVNANYDAPYAQGIGAINDKLGALAQFIGMNLTTQAMTAQLWQGGSFINFQIPFIFQAESNAEIDVMRPIKDLLRLTMPRDPSVGGILEAPGPHIDIKKLAQNASQAGQSSLSNLTSQGASGLVDTAKQVVNNGLDMNDLAKAKDQANNIAKQASRLIVNSVVNNISLYIGKFMYFPSVVVTDVSPTYDVVLNNAGKPMRATVNVGFRTFYIPTQNDIELMFSNMTVDVPEDYGAYF
jgi:hypothetical protein